MNNYKKVTQWEMLPDLMKQSLENDIMSQLSKELADEIDREVLNKIHGKMLEKDGWHRVTVKEWKCISDEWCATHIKGNYQRYGFYWYFKESKDATFFTLKWK
mgnify:CR=1 FL=1|tara:strand:+ start:162 stop:470 length:309 start_codon:yes stop_codon:yes gene_type:complete